MRPYDLIILEGVQGAGKTNLITFLKNDKTISEIAEFYHEEGKEDIPFAFREAVYWFNRLITYAQIAQTIANGKVAIAERSYLSGFVYKTFGFEPALMSLIYRGANIDPRRVLVIVLNKEDTEEELPAYKYTLLTQAGAPLGETVVMFNSVNDAFQYLMKLFPQKEE